MVNLESLTNGRVRQPAPNKSLTPDIVGFCKSGMKAFYGGFELVVVKATRHLEASYRTSKSKVGRRNVKVVKTLSIHEWLEDDQVITDGKNRRFLMNQATFNKAVRAFNNGKDYPCIK